VKVAAKGSPEAVSDLVKLVVGVQVWCCDVLCKISHDKEDKHEDANVSPDDQEAENDENVSAHIHHMLKRLNDLTIEDVHIICKDVQYLSNRGHIEEDIDWGFQDFSQRVLVDVSPDLALHSVHEIAAKI